MPTYSIRPGRDLADAAPQYELWLRATESLPRAWRSCLRNVECQLRHVELFPHCRLYAERENGELLGYIGTHPPFEWSPAAHGPPAESLGWAIPFGFPWTYPVDLALEVDLYDAMTQAVPQVYADFQRDIYVQRFRESWQRQIDFLLERGWRLHQRLPLLGRSTGAPPPEAPELSLVTPGDLEFIARCSAADDTVAESTSAETLKQRLDDGWIDGAAFWRLPDAGAFALEVRGSAAAVTFFATPPAHWDATLAAAAAQAASCGATEIYFTLDQGESRRRAALEQRGFGEVDAGVYYVRDAD